MKKLHAPTVALIASALSTSLLFAQAAPPRLPVPGQPPAARQAPPRRAPGDSMRGMPGKGGMPDRGGMDDIDFPGGGGPASQLLRARRQLDLTNEQVKALEALASAATPMNNRSDMMRAQADMMDATKGDGNIAAARSALEKMSRLRNDEAIARLKSRQDMRAVLTPTQKAQFDRMSVRTGTRMGKRRGEHNDERHMRNRGGRDGHEMMGPRNRQAPPMRPPNGQ